MISGKRATNTLYPTKVRAKKNWKFSRKVCANFARLCWTDCQCFDPTLLPQWNIEVKYSCAILIPEGVLNGFSTVYSLRHSPKPKQPSQNCVSFRRKFHHFCPFCSFLRGKSDATPPFSSQFFRLFLLFLRHSPPCFWSWFWRSNSFFTNNMMKGQNISIHLYRINAFSFCIKIWICVSQFAENFFFRSVKRRRDPIYLFIQFRSRKSKW